MTSTTTFADLRQQERQARKDLILDAAQKVFGAKTFDKVGLAEIAREAGIAKSSLYTYFPNQEALFMAAAIRETDLFIAEMDRLAKTEKRPNISTLVKRFLNFYTLHETHWRMITLFFLYGKIGQESAAPLNDMARRLMDCFERAVTHSNAHEDSRLLAHALFAALSGVLIAYRKYPGRSEVEVADHINRVGQKLTEIFTHYLDA